MFPASDGIGVRKSNTVNIEKNELRSKFVSQINFMRWQVALILSILSTPCVLKGSFTIVYCINGFVGFIFAYVYYSKKVCIIKGIIPKRCKI